ncbi:TetR/AcrR family transcriptional regulator [Streptoalloteichus hindustanus]|uniref:Transcriptional regulator, TetR family n=1 Tax=Streptoalloteichus hindustanus TaxID=2017 RepID=A0A1M5MIF2_STRHI|nr:TetR/AcrR family transcriptional regulator [Streptoalloteichus hindustanus]SHG77108.1 transcriptional regulator, TetR family [Streptoalloteichus hindustanus]
MPRRVDREARREEILQAAVRVFARKGFTAARIDDVAAEAGIAKGSVYLYFDSRDALLAAVFDSYAAHSAGVLAARSQGSPLERLADLVSTTIQFLASHPDHARVLLDLWSSGPPLDMAAVYREYREAVAGLLREAHAAGELRPGIGERHATVIVGAIEGCLVQWLVDPSVPLAELADPVIELCLDGVRA